MSGHSKWSKVKHQKGKTDQIKGQTFTRLANAITIAVRTGGGKREIEKAREANMPKANIDRAIERGLGKGEHFQLEEVIYEAFGPNKVALIIKSATDNKQRTTSNLKNILSEYGGILADPGSVTYMFKYIGVIKAKKGKLTDDQITEVAINVGSEDISIAPDSAKFYIDSSHYHQTQEKITKYRLEIIEAQLIYKPIVYVKVEDKGTAEKISQLIDKISQDSDIQNIFSNYEFYQ